MSWIPEVKTDDTGKWYSNALAFETKEEAEQYAIDLMKRWFAVHETRAIESDKPVTYIWLDNERRLVNLAEKHSHVPPIKISIE